MPRPTDTEREKFRERIRDFRDRRDQAVDKAEQTFWRAVADEIRDGHHGAQRDAAEALGWTRDHIRKRIHRYADQ